MEREPTSTHSKGVIFPRPARLGRREIVPLVAAFIGAALLMAFGLLAEEVIDGDTHHIDNALLMAFRTSEDPTDLIGPAWLEEMVRDVTALGSYAFVIIIVVASVGYLLLVRMPHLALLVAAAEAGGVLISTLLKSGFDRPRPDIDHAARVFTASFPSGHATLSAVTFLTLGVLLTRVTARRLEKLYFITLALILTLLVGTSRVYLGVHYPSDVLAGWCVGSAWALLCWAFALWLQGRGSVEDATPAVRSE